MIDQVELLVERLRDELKQYGELLALLDRQQELVLLRDAEGIQDTAKQIDHQASVLEEIKVARGEMQAQLSKTLGLASEMTFEELTPRLPLDYQPLVKALVEDNNGSVQRIARLARQNHMLLSRSIEMMGGLLRSVCPDQTPNVYNGRGAMQANFLSGGFSCEHFC